MAEITARVLNLKFINISRKEGKLLPEEIEFHKGDFLILDEREHNNTRPKPSPGQESAINTLIRKAISKNLAIFAVNPDPEIREILETPLSKGLFLKGREKYILIPRPEMAYITYSIKL